ncbi:nuclear pore complex protein Nup98-Nup96-like [Aphelenchoides avenae]|nr:nuclear pore complex protein Nup98-Nup96-like [Aphelenchus avenae]
MTARGGFSKQNKRSLFDRRDQQSIFGTTAPSTNRTLLGSGTTGAKGVPVCTTIKFDAPRAKDSMMKDNVTLPIDTRHMCITAMREYEAKSLEELRLVDYLAKGKSATIGAPPLPGNQQAAPTFGLTTVTTGGLPQNKPSLVSKSVPKKQDSNWTRKDPNGIFTSDESSDEDQPLETQVATKNKDPKGPVSSAKQAQVALEQNLKTTQTQLEAQQKEVQELRPGNEQIVTTVGKYSPDEHNKLQAQFDQQEQRLAQAVRDVEQLKKQLAEANTAAADAIEQAGSRSSEWEKLREEHKKNKENYEKARQLAIRFRNEREKLEKENDQLKAEKKALEEQLEMAAKVTKGAQTEATTTSAEFEKLREDHKTNKENFEKARQLAIRFRNKKEKLEKENDQLKADKKALEEQLEMAAKVTKGAQTEATTTSAEFEKLREDHKTNKENFEKARQLAIRFRNKKEKLEKENDQLKADKKAREEQLEMATKVIAKHLGETDVSPMDKVLFVQEDDALATRFVEKLTLSELQTIVTHKKKERLSKEVLLKLLNHKYGLMAHHG